SLNIIGIIPVDREARARGEDPLTGARNGLKRGDILVLFPEGTRGAPEEMADFKKGVSHLAEQHDGLPTVPVFLHGLGKIMPKGSHVPVPFFIDVFIGEPIVWTGNRDDYMSSLNRKIAELAAEGQFPSWD
ncbi:MAG: lysophospholipid acyltransferase family protein, partial [Woeseiaceae bacterium]